LGAIFGRKTASVANVGRASTSMRSAGQAMQQRGDVARAEEDLQSIEDEFHKLEEEVESAVNDIKDEFASAEHNIEKFTVRPKKSDLNVSKIGLVWTPWKLDSVGIATPAFRFEGTPQGTPADEQEDA
jgi:septal ring factor EnvC (AmiA/AmiB activator)